MLKRNRSLTAKQVTIILFLMAVLGIIALTLLGYTDSQNVNGTTMRAASVGKIQIETELIAALLGFLGFTLIFSALLKTTTNYDLWKWS